MIADWESYWYIGSVGGAAAGRVARRVGVHRPANPRGVRGDAFGCLEASGRMASGRAVKPRKRIGVLWTSPRGDTFALPVQP